jgi:hypothetical protein
MLQNTHSYLPTRGLSYYTNPARPPTPNIALPTNPKVDEAVLTPSKETTAEDDSIQDTGTIAKNKISWLPPTLESGGHAIEYY